MTSSDRSFDDLLERVRRGEEAAILELVGQYEAEVRIVARARLGPALRPYLDSIDLVQSVHRSILIGLRDDKFDISSPDRLVGLAMTIVRRKAARHWRRTRHQVRLSEFNGRSDVLANLLIGLRETFPDPASTVATKDALERVFSALSQDERRLIELRLHGYSIAEAARQLELNPDTTRANLRRLRDRLLELGITADVI